MLASVLPSKDTDHSMLHLQFNKKITYALFYATLGREKSWTGTQQAWVLASTLLPSSIGLGKVT